jgi:aminopeptidase N
MIKDDVFIIRHTVPVMWKDAYVRVQPLKILIRSNADINTIFSDLLVSKSAALIRMIEASVDPENFIEDVRVSGHLEFALNWEYILFVG